MTKHINPSATRIPRSFSTTTICILACMTIISATLFTSTAYALDTTAMTPESGLPATTRSIRTVFQSNPMSLKSDASVLKLGFARLNAMASSTSIRTNTLLRRRHFVPKEVVPASLTVASKSAGVATKLNGVVRPDIATGIPSKVSRVIYQGANIINKAESNVVKAMQATMHQIHKVVERGSPMYIHRVPSMKIQTAYIMDSAEAAAAKAAIPFMAATGNNNAMVMEGLEKIKAKAADMAASVQDRVEGTPADLKAKHLAAQTKAMRQSKQLLPSLLKQLFGAKSVQAYVLLGFSCMLIVAGILIPVVMFARNSAKYNRCRHARMAENECSEEQDLELGLRRANDSPSVSIDYDDSSSRLSLSDITEADWQREKNSAADSESSVIRLRVQFPKASPFDDLFSPLSSLFNGKPGRRTSNGILGNEFTASSLSSTSSFTDDLGNAASLTDSPKVRISKMYPEESGMLYDSFKSGFQTRRQLLGLDPVVREDEMV